MVDEKASKENKAAWVRSWWEAAVWTPSDRDGPGASSVEGANPPRPSPRKPVRPARMSWLCCVPIICSGAETPKGGLRKRPTPKRESSATHSISPPMCSRTKPIAEGAHPSSAKASPSSLDPPPYTPIASINNRPPPYTPTPSSFPHNNIAASQPPPYNNSNLAPPLRQRLPTASRHGQRRQRQPPSASVQPPPAPSYDDSTELIKQPETRSITQDQLVAEVKGIYAGLVMVESKCIEVDTSQAANATKLTHEQWQALVALHRTLLHEQHDFFLASQHPSANPALRRLAAKYAMPARMWRHAIHTFLELLRHRLPQSKEHMLSFICLAYSMMALLYETVPAFEDTWIECLGDLARYRMAVEDDFRERETWSSVGRLWYSKASDKAPTTGRLYHHLAIVSRPDVLKQLSYYSKSLCVEVPFLSARESIMTLFEFVLGREKDVEEKKKKNKAVVEVTATEVFVLTHRILFSGEEFEKLEPTMRTFLGDLDTHISRQTSSWLEPGYHVALSNICALAGYGDENNFISLALKTTALPMEDQQMQDVETPASQRTSIEANKKFPHALRLFTSTYNIVCRRFGDYNILSYLHVTLVFIYHLTFCPDAMAHVAPHFPWKRTALMLNTLVSFSSSSAEQLHNLSNLLESEVFLAIGEVRKGEDEDVEVTKLTKEESPAGNGAQENTKSLELVLPRRGRRPLPDDYAMRGFPWVERYFPGGWFDTDERVDDDDKYLELTSMILERRTRVLWLGARIAAREGGGKWLTFDPKTRMFGVNPAYEVELDLQMPEMPPTPSEGVDMDIEELPDAGSVA
ncbi:hypothetical protein VTI74DRAFT_3652 [Chaetomium olivicolor]